MTYIVSFRTNALSRKSPYVGSVSLSDETHTPTNEIRHMPPVDNGISRYAGSFGSEADAWTAVREWFPSAQRNGAEFTVFPQ